MIRTVKRIIYLNSVKKLFYGMEKSCFFAVQTEILNII
jgi:hypothetical protein